MVPWWVLIHSNVGQVSQISLGITRASPQHPVRSLQGITVNDILTENQTISSQEIMNIKLNYISMQNGTTFYLLDLGDYSWIMGLKVQCYVSLI